MSIKDAPGFAPNSNAGKGFAPKAKADRPAVAQPETAASQSSDPTEQPEPFDLSPTIAAAVALVGHEFTGMMS